ncbi:hypothetical protein [Sandarakinorhabdus sp. DWP1-3-1]|uniref:hypothetical protein n=1 Tax=Sandarakinorhabdus sp. DWP1-3-1 TaxID=2804627 RepID=UPI003CFBB989
MLTRRTTRWIALVALAWNFIGIAGYLAQVGITGPPGPAMPTAITAAFAIGVFAGAVGALGLSLLRPWAPVLLWVSLVAVVVNWGWVFLYSRHASIPLGLAVLVVAAVLVVVAETVRRRGWLGPTPR